MRRIWRTIARAPFYEVSNFGEVRRVTKARGTKTGPLKPKIDRYGYVYFTLSFGPGRPQRHVRAHRLVCESFHGPSPTPKHHVAHCDGNQKNNRSGNLRWATQAENMADMVRHGRSNTGEKNPQAKLTSAQVLEIRHDARRSTDLAKHYGVCVSTIRRVRHGHGWHVVAA